ncbi:MAG: NAD-dependent DNA ligase LigA [Clostridiales bacterium]|nr:NAD-dependent DNA ligase LigA [Clostridiales bacterium]
MADKLKRIKELVKLLNKANRAYYQEDREIMSNFEYDALYDELVSLESETGIVLSNSPTINVGYEVLSELPKTTHDVPMLSLNKTKDTGELVSWLGNHDGVLSWKLDGLTIVLTYNNGELTRAVTRGSGEIGEVITNNARVFTNLPLKISYTGELVLRGEAVIKYSDFNRINSEIPEIEGKYKNPRNLCSGSVRQLNNEITAKRNVHFFAFSLVSTSDDIDFDNSRIKQIEWLSSLGFDIVEYKRVNGANLEKSVEWFASNITNLDIPSDGLVLTYDDIEYGMSLGTTAKFPRDSIAFKWEDELKETSLIEVEWSASRTGLINPIAIFEPVELEGTTVSRASIHNISIMEALELGQGDTIQVYKANMIIPQIADNLTRSGSIKVPDQCPVCHEKTRLQKDNDVKVLYCINDECPAKKVKTFDHFTSRDAMNIEGLSEATIDKFVSKGFINEISDIFKLEKYKDEIVTMEGFGEKSYTNLINSINQARKTSPARLLYSLGIKNIGLSTAKLICNKFENDFNKVMKATKEELLTIPGIGEVIADSFLEYFSDEKRLEELDKILSEIEFETIESNQPQILQGKNIVITGSLNHYTNRKELQGVIEDLGGKVVSSVSSNTDFLINNNKESNSSKNKKAKELGIEIISEEDFIAMIKE